MEVQKGVKGLWKEANELYVLEPLMEKICTNISKSEYNEYKREVEKLNDGSEEFNKQSHYQLARKMKDLINKDYLEGNRTISARE